MSDSSSSPDGDQLDPLLVHARRESIVICTAFAAALLWSVPCCYLLGYDRPPEELADTVFGMPKWVFWGILIPWGLSDVFACWFCFWYMADDDLEEADPDVEEFPDEPHHEPGGGHA